MKLYLYKKCSTCRKASAFLDARGVAVKKIELLEQTPTKSELRRAIKEHGKQRVFNTSGLRYRELELSQKLKGMDEEAAIELLHSEPMLVKRPFLVAGESIALGFKENEWAELLG